MTPTCAVNVNKKDGVCKFYCASNDMYSESCLFTGAGLSRKNNGMGLLIPDSNCPIWFDHDNKTDK
jgi:hypothetical protein